MAAYPWLDGKHTVFGEVVEGIEIVDQLGSVETSQRDAPAEPVKIVKIDILRITHERVAEVMERTPAPSSEAEPTEVNPQSRVWHGA